MFHLLYMIVGVNFLQIVGGGLMNHAAKCIHLQLVEPIPVIHLVTEQRTGECNVINIHPCSRLVQRKPLNYKCHYVSTK